MGKTPDNRRKRNFTVPDLQKEASKRTGSTSQHRKSTTKNSRREAFLGSDTKKKSSYQTRSSSFSSKKRKNASASSNQRTSSVSGYKRKTTGKGTASKTRRTFTEDAGARQRASAGSGRTSQARKRPASNSSSGRGRNGYSGASRTTGNKNRNVRPSSQKNRTYQNRKKSRKNTGHNPFLILALIACVVIAGFIGVHSVKSYLLKRAVLKAQTEAKEKERRQIMDEAVKTAAGYDYDTAIEEVKAIDGYDSDEELKDLVKDWEKTKETLVGFTASEVTHIFYHTLVVDPDLAFGDAPAISNGFKQWMTTVTEFNRITKTMYEEGYVLVGLYDLFDETYDDDGNVHMTEKTIYLPEGKKPFILSLDDLSYYHTYTDHGMASKLVLDDEGKITCEYKEKDGTVVTGSYDCVPLINDFMEEHPDGAYRGARGTIALTGYNGVFGYRTDSSYVTKEDLDADKAEWLEANPDFDYDAECEAAKAIAEELKAEGWTFASHTWGHLRIGKIKLSKLKEDTEKWLANVEPIIGETDCIIFAHGQDMSSSGVYKAGNKKYKYLKSKGFNVFLNVDSHKYTMEIHDTYVHGGRRNLDGYRLWQDAHGYSDWTSDLFDASQILDAERTDMPEVTE